MSDLELFLKYKAARDEIDALADEYFALKGEPGRATFEALALATLALEQKMEVWDPQ